MHRFNLVAFFFALIEGEGLSVALYLVAREREGLPVTLVFSGEREGGTFNFIGFYLG